MELIAERLGFCIPVTTLNDIQAEQDRCFTTLHLKRRRLRVGMASATVSVGQVFPSTTRPGPSSSRQ